MQEQDSAGTHTIDVVHLRVMIQEQSQGLHVSHSCSPVQGLPVDLDRENGAVRIVPSLKVYGWLRITRFDPLLHRELDASYSSTFSVRLL
ncbi:hypothetical protein JZ751_020703 [Albula glossodonta]|uniref:Uncharacterized protein n=1 Tax=Albula glossodonta TaxID=121402 RepID=A0A8T2PJA6_9TELE|nr:hypothetical protein JZ751_020703 [Albula glossodonta]